MTDAELCLSILSEAAPAGSSLPVISFAGDPYKVDRRAWGARSWNPAGPALNPAHNLFVGISSFALTDASLGRFQSRKKDDFMALQAIMIDDVGTGQGSKLPMSKVKLDPTWMIETSPDNYQAWYVLKIPCFDRQLAEDFIESLVNNGLAAETDPGMRGVSRVGRLPGGVNGKAKYGAGFVTRLCDINEDARFDLHQIAQAYGISPERKPARAHTAYALPEGVTAVSAICEMLPRLFKLDGMVMGETSRSGWTPIVCPWVHEHTGGECTGAAYSMPSIENRYAGGFQCHHGHCVDKTISHVIAWANTRIKQLEEGREHT